MLGYNQLCTCQPQFKSHTRKCLRGQSTCNIPHVYRPSSLMGRRLTSIASPLHARLVGTGVGPFWYGR